MSERQVKAAEVVKVLTEARQIISAPRNWTKGHWRVYDEDKFCPASEEEAYLVSDKFCSLGAIYRRNPNKIGEIYEPAVEALASVVPHRFYDSHDKRATVFSFNDSASTSHEEVLAAFDKAIEQQCKIVREEAEKDDSHLSD